MRIDSYYCRCRCRHGIFRHHACGKVRNMRIKRILALFICAVMAVSFAPITANADETKEYTVILSPGEGSGAPIVYSADKNEITKTWQTAENCEFYKDGESVGFRIKDDYYPDSFTAPEGTSFKDWDIRTGNYTTIQRGTTTFTAVYGLPRSDDGSINNIPPFFGDECYTIAGIEWKLIGKDEERGIGLLITKDLTKMPTCMWASCLDNTRQAIPNQDYLITELVIPTSKAKELFFHEDMSCSSLDLSEILYFELSVPEIEYYNANDKLSQTWWTRSYNDEDSEALAVTDEGIKGFDEDSNAYVRPAMRVNLDLLDDTVQALPPAFPEGVFQTKTGVYKITDKEKKEVQMIEGSVSAKGVLTVPKTVTYEKKRYKVTSIREMTFDGNSELKTIKITAGNLRDVGDNAFRFINKKAVFKIKGTVKAFKKLRKIIKASAGLPKTVKFKRVKV